MHMDEERAQIPAGKKPYAEARACAWTGLGGRPKILVVQRSDRSGTSALRARAVRATSGICQELEGA